MYMHNMSYGEARRRAQEYGATMCYYPSEGNYLVYLNEWGYKERQDKGYYTDDAEDAYLTAAVMRRKNPRNTTL